MLTIEELELKELESKYKHYEYQKHLYTQQVYDDYSPYINQKSNSWRMLRKSGALMKEYIEWCWIEMQN
jgi:hypothetical protein